MKNVNVAVVGATGLVGRKILEILEERNFPINNIIFLASEKSEGKTIEFRGKSYKVKKLDENSFDGEIDLAPVSYTHLTLPTKRIV